MGLTLQLTRNVLNTFVGWKAQVLHDLHESVPYLYDNTVGDGPYNAWIDPILADEWQMMGWNNVSEMTKFGMPGVFTHGTFDTWSPSYLMFIAAMHNGISRLYETFGNGGADTEERTLRPNEYARTWFKQNPPLPKTKWSQRNNNNYEETGVLTALAYFAANNKLFLRNFYLKAKRSIEKATHRGTGRLRLSGRRSAPRRAGGSAANVAGPGLRDLPRHRAVHRDDAGQESARARRPRWTRRRRDRHRRRPTLRTDATAQAGGKAQARAAHLPRGQLRSAHGSALQPHRRYAARLPILGGQRSAEEHLRRYRLDLRRTRQRAGGARDRRQGAGRRDGPPSTGPVQAPGRRGGHGRRFS